MAHYYPSVVFDNLNSIQLQLYLEAIPKIENSHQHAISVYASQHLNGKGGKGNPGEGKGVDNPYLPHEFLPYGEQRKTSLSRQAGKEFLQMVKADKIPLWAYELIDIAEAEYVAKD
jgi:hypothetical protein